MQIVAPFSSRLKEAMGNMSGADLSLKLGISKQSVSAYLTGTRKPKRITIFEIARRLNVNEAWLIGYDVSRRRAPEPNPCRVPVYGNVAAGIPIEAITDIEDYEEISSDMARGGEFIALKIKGQSMEPKISEGDVVIVRLQPEVEDGEIAIVMINGDDATCKRIRHTADGVMLISTNPQNEPLYYSSKQCRELPVRILGKVVELRAKF